MSLPSVMSATCASSVVLQTEAQAGRLWISPAAARSRDWWQSYDSGEFSACAGLEADATSTRYSQATAAGPTRASGSFRAGLPPSPMITKTWRAYGRVG